MVLPPQIIHFNRVFHCEPSILGYPYFWKHLHIFCPADFFFWGGPEEYKIHQKIHDEDDDDDEMAAAFLALTHLLMYDSSCE